MAAKKLGYRVLLDRRRDKFVMRKGLYDPHRFDVYPTKPAAREVIHRNTRKAIDEKLRAQKEASWRKITQGIRSLTPEDLTNLRDWFVALIERVPC